MEKEKRRILIVDDDPKMVELLRDHLDKDYKIDIACDGEEALAKTINLGSDRPDLIVLDVILPKINGHEVAKIIKENESCKSIPIIMLSSMDQPLDKITGLVNSKADYYLTKPINMSDLLVLILKIFSAS